MTEVQAPETPDDKHASFYEEDGYHTRVSEDSTEWVPPSTSQEHLPAEPRPDSGHCESISKEIAYACHINSALSSILNLTRSVTSSPTFLIPGQLLHLRSADCDSQQNDRTLQLSLRTVLF